MTTQTIETRTQVSPRHAQQYRAYVRQQAPNPHGRNRRGYPVQVVDGDSAPVARGQSWHYETRGGTYISHPSAYSKSGWSNMVYCSSTKRVEVGREWLATRCIPESAMEVR